MYVYGWLWLCVCVCVYMCVVWVCVCVCVCIGVVGGSCVCLYVCLCMCLCICLCVCVCVSVCACITHLYTYEDYACLCVHVWMPEVNIRCLLFTPCLVLWDRSLCAHQPEWLVSKLCLSWLILPIAGFLGVHWTFIWILGIQTRVPFKN